MRPDAPEVSAPRGGRRDGMTCFARTEERLAEAEKGQERVGFNRPEAPFPPEPCIHQLFEVQAKRTTESTAVVCGNQHLSYAALNGRANQLAHSLQRRGVGPEVP